MRLIRQDKSSRSTLLTAKKALVQGAVFASCIVGFNASLLSAKTSAGITQEHSAQHAASLSEPVYLDPNSTQLIEKMKNVISWHRELVNQGGWQNLSLDEVLEFGSKGPAVAALANRLIQGGDLTHTSCISYSTLSQAKAIEPCVFDLNIQQAVKSFQQRHGLSVDGVVGKKTLRELNIPAKKRYAQLLLNFQRMTQFSGLTNEEYVLVNIPEFKLRYINKGNVILKNRVVVGKPSWKTPAFSDQIEKFVVNPTWRIPLSIATREIASKVADDPDYLAKKNIEIRENSYIDKNIIPAGEINWDEIAPYQFKHFLVKRAGKDNPLGEIKYLFPNVNAIYIHDTPAKNWFKQTKRAASHGCIRMEQPFSLAKAIIEKQGLDVFNDVNQARDADQTRTFHLKKPVPIHLVYWTAWVDETDTVNFRTDVYNRDKNLHLLELQEPMIAANYSVDQRAVTP